MGFIDAVKSGFSNYANFNGRACRSEYWWWFLFSVIMGFLSLIPILGTIIMLAMLLPSIAVHVRRLHDIGRSGWWWFLCLVPLGALVLIYFAILKGTEGENEYGADPLAA